MRRNRHELKKEDKELKISPSNKTGPALETVTKQKSRDTEFGQDMLDVPEEYRKRLNDSDRDYEHMQE